MSIIAAGTSSGTALVSTGDTNGTLVIQTNGTTVAATFGTDQKLTLAGALVTTGVSTFAAGSAAAPSITTTGDTNTGVFFPAADTIGFSDGGAEAMRIDSSGNLLVGTTSTGPAISVGFAMVPQGVTNNYLAIGHPNTTSSGNGYIAFAYNSTLIGTITQNGTTAVSYNTTSDYRLKENIAPMTGALARIAALKPVTYTWKAAPDETGEGFIAHELAEVCPQAVTGEKDAVQEEQYEVTPAVKDEEGNTITDAVMGTRTVPVYQGIDTSFLVATLTAAIQELKAEFDAYKAAHP